MLGANIFYLDSRIGLKIPDACIYVKTIAFCEPIKQSLLELCHGVKTKAQPTIIDVVIIRDIKFPRLVSGTPQ